MARMFTGLVYVKQGRVGSCSEGPDYYLQTTLGDFALHFRERPLCQPDYQLDFYCRKMVELHGVLRAPRLVEVQSLTEIISPRLPTMKYSDYPALNEPVQLELGRAVIFPEEKLRLDFDAVTQDSRCPPGTVCIWEGYATVSLALWVPRTPPVNFSLTLHAGHPELAVALVGGYRIALEQLEPAGPPLATDPKLRYVVTLLVSYADPATGPAPC